MPLAPPVTTATRLRSSFIFRFSFASPGDSSVDLPLDKTV
jgi:hypothetical protein